LKKTYGKKKRVGGKEREGGKAINPLGSKGAHGGKNPQGVKVENEVVDFRPSMPRRGQVGERMRQKG